MGQLGDGKDPLSSVTLDLLLPDSTQQTEVVGFDGLRLATLLEFTNFAVWVQGKTWLNFVGECLLQGGDQSIGIGKMTIQPNFTDLCVPTMHDQAELWALPLKLRESKAIERE